MPSTSEERESQRGLMAEKRAKEREIVIPPCVNPKRKMDCAKDVYLFLSTYFPQKFSGAFTEDRRAMVENILHAATFGQDQAVAAPRGEGKTTIAEIVGGIFCPLVGLLRFPLIIASTGPDAERILANIKMEYETNELLWEDYPEVCEPIRRLEGANQRCAMQVVKGSGRTRMKWSGKYIVLPTVQGSVASGAVLMSRGLDGAIRGIRYGNMRPDLAIIDDPETRESANSSTQTNQRELTIEQDIAGLGGPGKRISRVLLTTVSNRHCLSWAFTDPKIKPSWNGKRYKLLVQKPEREDLWEEYMHLRRGGKASGDDRDATQANAMYIARKEEMDFGAIVGNPERFVKGTYDDGTPIEISALQSCYNMIADLGWENFATEYQNDPPEEDSTDESGVTVHTIQNKLSMVPKGIIPDGTVLLTKAIDIGKRALHWVVIAWKSDATGSVIDYGVQEVYGEQLPEDGLRRAIISALLDLRDAWEKEPYHTRDGEIIPVGAVFVDTGWEDVVVYEFVRQVGGRPFWPAKGFGQGRGMSSYSQGHNSENKKIGEHWFMSRQENGFILMGLDSDYWKRWVHDRFATDLSRSGTMTVFGEDSRRHFSYAKHLTAEIEVEEFEKGKGVRRYWHRESRNNHWFDATYMACAAASFCQVSLIPSTQPATQYVAAEATPPAVVSQPPPRREARSSSSSGWEVSL